MPREGGQPLPVIAIGPIVLGLAMIADAIRVLITPVWEIQMNRLRLRDLHDEFAGRTEHCLRPGLFRQPRETIRLLRLK